MSFMQPVVVYGEYFEVETTLGVEIVPADLVSGDLVKAEDLTNWFSGRPLEPSSWLEKQSGYLARMSAPGYMDCTSWTAHKTEQEALDFLRETYMDDDETSESETERN